MVNNNPIQTNQPISDIYSVAPANVPPLNAFDLAHNHYMDLKMGEIYPIGWFECVPADIFDISVDSLIQFINPMLTPILNNIECEIHAFFIPTRLLWKKFEDFITTVDQDSIPPKSFLDSPPVWCQFDDTAQTSLPAIELSEGSLWDTLGFSRKFSTSASKEYRPTDFLRRAYYKIWNEWFRDENLQEPIDYYNSEEQTLKRRAWKKDYFTAGYISRQKGKSPAISLVNSTDYIFKGHIFPDYYKNTEVTQQLVYNNSMKEGDNFVKEAVEQGKINAPINTATNPYDVVSFDTNDLRDMIQIQRFYEKLMTNGSRYIEFLTSQFGVSPSDERLNIPERIGGMKFNIEITQIAQTGAAGTYSVAPIGSYVGNGITKASGRIGSYKVEEFGYIMLLANIQPPAIYTDRIHRSQFRKTLLEQVNPHFVNLGFQSVEKREIYALGTSEDNTIFNFAGRYDELRSMESYITGKLTSSLIGHAQYRSFKTSPSYNADFIESKPDKSVFAVVDDSEPDFIANFNIDCKALRPIPLYSEPSLIDHLYGTM